MTNDFRRSAFDRASDPPGDSHSHSHHHDRYDDGVEVDPVARRSFLKLMGASLGLAGFTACTRQPPERIMPYVTQPEGVTPGKPLFYATAITLGGIATGVL